MLATEIEVLLSAKVFSSSTTRNWLSDTARIDSIHFGLEPTLQRLGTHDVRRRVWIRLLIVPTCLQGSWIHHKPLGQQ